MVMRCGACRSFGRYALCRAKAATGAGAAVGHRAPIWVLDEPTVSLDADAVALFGSALRGHLAAGGSALKATHIDLGVDARVLDISTFRAAPDADLGASDAAFL